MDFCLETTSIDRWLDYVTFAKSKLWDENDRINDEKL